MLIIQEAKKATDPDDWLEGFLGTNPMARTVAALALIYCTFCQNRRQIGNRSFSVVPNIMCIESLRRNLKLGRKSEELFVPLLSV